MSKFYEDLKEGLEEIIAYKQGKIKLKMEVYEKPELQAESKAKVIKIPHVPFYFIRHGQTDWNKESELHTA